MYGPYKNNQLVPDLDAILGDGKVMLYVICTNTKDYGDKFTVRRHAITKHSHAQQTLYVEDKVEVRDTILEARAVIPEGFYNLERFDEDDPVIVEVWI